MILPLIPTGCIPNTADPSARAATSIDPKKAQSEYWFRLPAIEQIKASDYDQLWNACENTAQDFSFTVDRVDYRTGLITTKPLISKQFFEFWRRDVLDFESQADSDTTTHRRVAHFKIARLADDSYVCEPRVVVEHYAMPERRITAVYQYQDAFSLHRQFEEQTNDDGTPLRVDYWYAERRDEVLERAMAARIREYLRGAPPPFRVTVTEAPPT
jgi:hypothetical protein